MGQLDFFLKKTEKIDFIEFAISKGCKIIPDINYSSDSYIVLETSKDFAECNETSQFFLINDKYTLFPMEMRPIEKNGLRVYYISQRQGGPAINFYSPNTIEDSNGMIGHGHIAYYPFYYTGPAQIKAPDDLKTIYNLFVSFIKKRSKRISLPKRSYWVGNSTIESIKEGKLGLVSSGDFDLTEIAKGL